MAAFSAKSLERLKTCHPDLQRLFHAVLEHRDCSILCGHRGEQEQEEVLADGRSKVGWPNSRHNSEPSEAVDAAPWPINWADLTGFHKFADLVKDQAVKLGIEIEWGGDFEHFPDLDHFQLKR